MVESGELTIMPASLLPFPCSFFLVWQWRYRFTRDCLTPVVESLCSAKRIKYSEVLELDKLVRGFEPHPYSIREAKPMHDGVCIHPQDGLMSFLLPTVTVWWKYTAIQRLHRNFFARALIESAADPRKSVYAPSFFSAFESSKILLKLVILGYPKLEMFLLRLHPIWANSLASAVRVLFAMIEA